MVELIRETKATDAIPAAIKVVPNSVFQGVNTKIAIAISTALSKT